ncbi:MAG: hypothetical protein H9847_03470, partial [Candidatus Anaerobiospirillum pullicola]|nr:hypothetical protein [Candidatus Anaerobiospirillum pullicola]
MQASAAAATVDAVQQVPPQVDDSDCQDVTVESDGTVVANADAPYVEMPLQLLLALQQESGLAAGDESDLGDNSTVAPSESLLLNPSADTVVPPESSALPLLPLLACLESEHNHDVMVESDGTDVAHDDVPYAEQPPLLLLAFNPVPCVGAGDNSVCDNSNVALSKSAQLISSADTVVLPESPALPLLPYHKPEGTQATMLTSGLTVVANAEAPYKKMPTRLLMQALQPVPLLASGADSMLAHSKSAQFNPAVDSVVPPKAAAQPLLPLLACLESEDNQGVTVESDGTVVANADAPYMEMPQQGALPPQDATPSPAVSAVATASTAKSTGLISRPVAAMLSEGLHQFLEHAQQQQAQEKANGDLPVRERDSYLSLRELYALPATDPRMVAYNRAALRTYTAPNSQQLPIHCDLYQFDFTEALKKLKLGPVMFCGESEPCHSFDFTSAAEYLSVANVSTQRYHYSESRLSKLFEQFFRFSVLSEICYYSEDMFALPDDKAPRLDEKQLKEFFATKQQGMLLQLLGVTHGFTSGPYMDAERCKVSWCSKSLWDSISRNMHLYRSKSPLPFLRACVRRQLLHGLKDEDSYKAMLQVFKCEFRHFIQEQLWVKHYSFPATTDANCMQHFYPSAFRRLMSVDGQNMVFRLTYPMLLWRKIGCVREASGLARCENFINNDNAAMLLIESAYNPQVQEQWANFVAAFGKHYPFLAKLGGCEHV